MLHAEANQAKCFYNFKTMQQSDTLFGTKLGMAMVRQSLVTTGWGHANFANFLGGSFRPGDSMSPIYMKVCTFVRTYEYVCTRGSHMRELSSFKTQHTCVYVCV